MWTNSTVVYEKSVKWETIWISEGNTSTARYKGRKHHPGDVWVDKEGVYHAVTLNQTGEGASLDGEMQIEEFIARKKKFEQAFSVKDITVTEE